MTVPSRTRWATWPDYQWHRKEEAFPLRRGGEYKGKSNLLDADTMKALRWYWNQLRWRAEEDGQPDDVGVSWKELSIAFWAATGLITRFPRNNAKRTTLQHMAEAFAKASRKVEEEDRVGGGWLWRGVCDRTSARPEGGRDWPEASTTVGLRSGSWLHALPHDRGGGPRDFDGGCGGMAACSAASLAKVEA